MRLGLGLRLRPPSVFNPIAALFANGEKGAWYDPSDLSTLFQDAAGTIPVTGVEQPVGLMRDKSGRGNHAFQTTSASRPVLSGRYNLLTKTDQFDAAAWSKVGSTCSDGMTVLETDTTGQHIVYTPTLDLPSSIFRIEAKPYGRDWLRVTTRIGGASRTAFFQLVGNGVVGVNPSGAVAEIELLQSGWYLCTITGPMESNSSGLQIGPTTGSGVSSYAGDISKGVLLRAVDLRAANDGVNLPPYQRVNTTTDYDTAGFPLYLRCDGVDDGMVTNSIDFTGTDKMTVWAGVRKLSDAAAGTVIDFNGTAGTNAFMLRAPGTDTTTSYAFYSGGSIVLGGVAEASSGYAAPITNVLTGIGDVSGDRAILRVNGTQAAASVADQGTGTYGNYPLYLFRRGGVTRPFNGRFYGAIIRGAQSSQGQIDSGESFLNSKTKAY